MADNSDLLNQLSSDQRKQAEDAQAPVAEKDEPSVSPARTPKTKAADPDAGK